MTSIEPLDPEIKNLINNQLDFILNFAEFISGERPSSNYTRIIAELRLFQKKLLERDSLPQHMQKLFDTKIGF
ncbi:MAG: hypothetical protein QOK85_05725 [Nitrososphaeraceae archaeon]|nr:hypothetical protein [Nitrososphaeraceae archaeon]